MKRYKLIKKYPGSPELGSICKKDCNNRWVYSIDFSKSSSYYNSGNPQDYSEFWQEIVEYPIGTKVHNSQTNTIYTKKEDGWYKPAEKTAYTDEMIGGYKHLNLLGKSEKVVEKDYEIVSFYAKNISGKGDDFVDPDYIWYETSKGNGEWSRKGHITAPYNTQEITNHSGYGIHSVKRLSDGEIFTVEDNTNEGIIKDFQLCKDDRIIISFIDGLPRYLDAKGSTHVLKVKQPLFTTEDGVEVFEGDKYYFLITSSLLGGDNIARDKKVLQDYPLYKYFSSKEAREEYILMNKPCLSINDITEHFNTHCSKDTFTTSKTELIKLVKTKI